jgi:hypothetical protein
MVLTGPKFMSFFEKVEVANFEIASDAFTTFKVRARRVGAYGAPGCLRARARRRPACRPACA